MKMPGQPQSPDGQGKTPPLPQQPVPVMRVVGRIGGGGRESGDIAEAGVKYLLHAGWTDLTYQVSARGLKLLRGVDVQIIDEPETYSI